MKKLNRKRAASAEVSYPEVIDREIALLEKLPRKELLREAATAKVNLRGWMYSTNCAWDIVINNDLRDGTTETLNVAVNRNLLLVAKMRNLLSKSKST